jgi:endonuclease/exonuclease/phosphatase family metal-dependent hydrolase
MPMPLRLTTLNLQGFTEWEARQADIEDYLLTVAPDIVFFQEVVFLPNIMPLNQAQLLNQTLNYPYINSAVTRLQASEAYENYREGLALISRHPILSADTIVLKQAAGDQHNRIIQLVDIQVGEQRVKLANVHFSLTDDTDFATAHLEETLSIFEARGEERIIAGDFNINDLDRLQHLWGDKYVASTAERYISFPIKGTRIDYFLIPKQYTFGGLQVSGDTLSDHRAVTADILTF